MSIFLLNLLVKFLKVLPKSKFIWNSKSISILKPSLGKGPAHPSRPTLPRRSPPPRTAQSRKALVHSPKGVFPLGLHVPPSCLFSSPVTDMWAPHVRPFFSPPALPPNTTALDHFCHPSLSIEMPDPSLNSPTLNAPF
jgi:hypothetical protein